jgi:hypothetical protein
MDYNGPFLHLAHLPSSVTSESLFHYSRPRPSASGCVHGLHTAVRSNTGNTASSSRGVPHSVSLGRGCARCANDRPLRPALRVRTPGLACCAAGWSPPAGRARSESVLAPCAMLAWPVSIELIGLPFFHSSHVAVQHMTPAAGFLHVGAAVCRPHVGAAVCPPPVPPLCVACSSAGPRTSAGAAAPPARRWS